MSKHSSAFEQYNGTHFEIMNYGNRHTLEVGDELMIRIAETSDVELHEIIAETKTRWIIETGERYMKGSGVRVKGSGQRLDETIYAYIYGRAVDESVVTERARENARHRHNMQTARTSAELNVDMLSEGIVDAYADELHDAVSETANFDTIIVDTSRVNGSITASKHGDIWAVLIDGAAAGHIVYFDATYHCVYADAAASADAARDVAIADRRTSTRPTLGTRRNTWESAYIDIVVQHVHPKRKMQRGIALADVHPGDIIVLDREDVDVIAAARTIDRDFVYLTYKTTDAEQLVMSDRFSAAKYVDRYMR